MSSWETQVPSPLFEVEAELVAAPGRLAGGGEAEHEHRVRLELPAGGIAGAHELGARVQAEHPAPVGAEHPLAQEPLLALAGVVGAEGDVDVVLRNREDLHAQLVLLRHVDHDELGAWARLPDVAHRHRPLVREAVVLLVRDAHVEVADRVELLVVAHLPADVHERHRAHELQHLVELVGRLLDDAELLGGSLGQHDLGAAAEVYGLRRHARGDRREPKRRAVGGDHGGLERLAAQGAQGDVLDVGTVEGAAQVLGETPVDVGIVGCGHGHLVGQRTARGEDSRL